MKAILMALSVLALTAYAPAPDEVQAEQKKFQGTWVVEKAVADGEEVPAEVFKNFKMIFRGDEYTALIGENKTEGVFKVDPSRKPKAIDIYPETGPDKGKAQPGVYEIDATTLKIFAAQPGSPRPADFETKGKKGYTLIVLRKEK